MTVLRPVPDVVESDVVIVGSGVAGMTAALACGLPRITLLSKTEGMIGGSTPWAQGGIAAAIGDDDRPDLHAADTVAAGGGLVDPGVAGLLADEGGRAIRALIENGLPVDRRADGSPDLSGEAAHSRRRVVHAGGDATGRHVAEFLAAKVVADSRIAFHAAAMAVELVLTGGRIAGLRAFHRNRGWVFHRAPRVVLATGGIGQAYSRTTAPVECTGDGLVLAANTGVELVDMEFVQFHPTALEFRTIGQQRPLLTEALRGDGAFLIDAAGNRIMADVHPALDLAPRDVVARAVWLRIAAGGRVFLDLRAIMRNGGADRFPTVFDICRRAGIDPFREPVPVAPVAHYHMGGVATDRNGRTSLAGLWACGEAACTGVHGANRLASNSLLEGIVFGDRVARDMTGTVPGMDSAVDVPEAPTIPVLPRNRIAVLRRQLNDWVYRGAGIVRDERGMVSALKAVVAIETTLSAAPRRSDFKDFDHLRAITELTNLVVVAKTILVAALERRESRGAHRRTDFPAVRPGVGRRFLDSQVIECCVAFWCARPESILSKAG